jgi:hypothetical protein
MFGAIGWVFEDFPLQLFEQLTCSSSSVQPCVIAKQKNYRAE